MISIRDGVVALVLGGIVSFIPLVGDFNVDFGSFSAIVFGFLAGLYSARDKRSTFFPLRWLLLWSLFAIVPLISSFYHGCFTEMGTIAAFSLAVSSITVLHFLGRYCKVQFGIASPFVFVALWLVFGWGGLALDFYSSPKAFFGHPFFGWWPGPAFDGPFEISSRFIALLIMSALTAHLLWFASTLNR